MFIGHTQLTKCERTAPACSNLTTAVLDYLKTFSLDPPPMLCELHILMSFNYE